MNKKLFLSAALLTVTLSFALSGCSADDERAQSEVTAQKDSVGMVPFLCGMVIPYAPVDKESLPDWLQVMAAEPVSQVGSFMINKADMSGTVVYHVMASYMSAMYGQFYNEHGEQLVLDGKVEKFIKEAADWKCIYYLNRQ